MKLVVYLLMNFIRNEMKRNTSPHILNTAANLLGFCLFVITSLHISNKREEIGRASCRERVLQVV